MTSEIKTCQSCTKDFTIESEDFVFYEKMSVPAPTWCPVCRLQRRLSWRNERAFYKRSCSMCSKSMVATYPESSSFPVYCNACWNGDSWDPLSYGKEYDFLRSFFEQFQELQLVVPRIALQASRVVNSEYANQIGDCKNCYLISSGSENENCAYGYRIMNSRDIFDSLIILRCEQCYGSSECIDSSRIFFSKDIAGSYDLSFCFESQGSNSCFMSSNLRHASYRFRNEQLTKSEYLDRIQEIALGSYAKVEEYKKEFADLQKNTLRKYANFLNVQDFSGYTGANVKSCHNCFNVADIENGKYLFFVNESKDVMDVNNGCCTMEKIYETSSVGTNVVDLAFCTDAWPEIQRLRYCDTCRNGATDLFGCISVRKRQYCILNKQYSKEEYEILLPKVIEQMMRVPYVDSKGREYRFGEFFPPEHSPFSYGDTFAQDLFPLNKESAISFGARWQNEEKRGHTATVRSKDMPDHIRDTPDSILEEIVECAHQGTCKERCTEGFRITPQELLFYRSNSICLPRLCPNCRHYERISQRNPPRLWKRSCMCEEAAHPHGKAGCGVEFETSYAPEKPETIYCETCYNAEIA